MTNDSEKMEKPLALLLFTRQFALLLQAGISLARSFSIMQHDTPLSAVEAAKELKIQVLEGHPVSRVMAAMPDFFPPFYTKMVRVGEIGGILDVIMMDLADWLEEEWKLSVWAGSQEKWIGFLAPSDRPMPQDWSELSGYQRKFALMLFCRSLGAMLSSGVPVNLALETAADLLPAVQRDEVRDLAQRDLAQGIAGPLSRIGFLPMLVTELLAVGEETHLLHDMLDKAADIYQHDLRYEMMQSSKAGRNG